MRHDGYEVRSFPVEHRVTAYGYAIVEDERPGTSMPSAAAELGVSHGPDLGRLQRGEEVEVNGTTVSPSEVMGETRIGRKVVVTGDTVPTEMTKLAAHEAQLLVHDAAFADADAQRAAETGHSTARQAAEIASEAGVEMLALVHASTRYDVRELLAEAREVMPGAIAPARLRRRRDPVPRAWLAEADRARRQARTSDRARAGIGKRARQDSNLRLPAPEAGALSTELRALGG